MKIIYLGTPEFSAKILNALINSKHKIVGVVCQPDKKVGRKQILQSPETKILAEKHNIPVFQFQKIRKDGVEVLKSLDADIMVTCAYGQILSQSVLDITPYGVINVHASLLPKHRGSAPVQWSIMNSENITGITIMKTDIGLDTGDIILKQEIKIDIDDNTNNVLEKMSIIAPELLLNALELIEKGIVKYCAQDNNLATYEPMLNREIAKINFSQSNRTVHDKIRALIEWPTAYTFLNGVELKIYQSKLIDQHFDGKVGEIVKADKNGLIVKCGQFALSLISLQFEGGKILNFKDIINGKKIKLGDILE